MYKHISFLSYSVYTIKSLLFQSWIPELMDHKQDVNNKQSSHTTRDLMKYDDQTK